MRANVIDYWACSASAIGIPMSMALSFDTLRAAKQLQKSGFAQPQAEAIINIISDKHEHLATKSDLEILRIDLETIKEATKAEFKNPRQKTIMDNEKLRETTQAYVESSRKIRTWLKCYCGALGAMLVLMIIKILSLLLAPT